MADCRLRTATRAFGSNGLKQDDATKVSAQHKNLPQAGDAAAAVAAADAFGWKSRAEKPGAMRDGNWLIGWGCATSLYPTHVGPAAARVRLMPNGNVTVQIAAHEIGNGIYTVLGQFASEQLGVELSSVNVEVGDSRLPPAPVAGGSNTTASSCSALLKACEAIRARLFHAAITANDAPLAGRAIGELTLADGRVTASDGAGEKIERLCARWSGAHRSRRALCR
jgi:xanthine dehydrogenase YagR molybdenum-binding subunit